MNAEKAIREAIRDWYGSLYEIGYDATTEALTKLDQLLIKEPEEELLMKPHGFYGRRRYNVNTH